MYSSIAFYAVILINLLILVTTKSVNETIENDLNGYILNYDFLSES